MKRWFRARYGVRLSRWLWGPAAESIELVSPPQPLRPSPMIGQLARSGLDRPSR